jgi:hypothetical protein
MTAPGPPQPAAGWAEITSSKAVAMRAFPSVSSTNPLRDPPQATAVLDHLGTGFTYCPPDFAATIFDRLANGESMRVIGAGPPNRAIVLLAFYTTSGGITASCLVRYCGRTGTTTVPTRTAVRLGPLSNVRHLDPALRVLAGAGGVRVLRLRRMRMIEVDVARLEWAM